MKSILTNRPALQAVIDQIAEVTSYLWQKGWAERNGGNITVNVTEYVDDEIKAMPAIAPVKQIGMVLPQLKGKYFYCKGTGKRMRDLARWPMKNGSIIRICEDGASYEIIADEPVVPTSELPTHLALQNYLLETGSCYKATLHTHPIELVAMSHIPRFLRDLCNWQRQRWNRLRNMMWCCGRSMVRWRWDRTSWMPSTKQTCFARRLTSTCVPVTWVMNLRA